MFRRRRARDEDVETTSDERGEPFDDATDAADSDEEFEDDYDEDEDDYEDDDGGFVDVDDDEDSEAVAGVEVSGPRADGPYDVDEVGTIDHDAEGILDLGALILRDVEGLTVQVEVDQATGAGLGVTMVEGNGALQIHVFAAPRTLGVWDEMRRELAADATRRGGTATELDGPYGPELKVSIPVTTAEGRQGRQITRLVGVDGPRWMLRGAFVGLAAEPDKSPRLDKAFRDVVVVRGQDPMAPTDLLRLTVPTAGRGPVEQPGPAESPYGPLKRGPEITEIH